MSKRTCSHIRPDGGPCRMYPLRDSDRCWSHDPNVAEQRAEARIKGGSRRRPGTTIAGITDVRVLRGVKFRRIEEIQEFLELVATETLMMENSLSRSKVLAHIGRTALLAIALKSSQEHVSTKMLDDVVGRLARGTDVA